MAAVAASDTGTTTPGSASAGHRTPSSSATATTTGRANVGAPSAAAASHVRYDVVSTIDAFAELIPPTPCNIAAFNRDLHAEFDAAVRHVAFLNDLLERRRSDPEVPSGLRPAAHVGGILNGHEFVATATALGRPPTLAPDRGSNGGSAASPTSAGSPHNAAGGSFSDSGAPFEAGSRPRDLTLPPHCAVLLSEDYALDYTVRIRRHVGEIGVCVTSTATTLTTPDGSTSPSNAAVAAAADDAAAPSPAPRAASVASPTAGGLARLPVPPAATAVQDFLSGALTLLSACSAVPYAGATSPSAIAADEGRSLVFGFLTPSSFAIDDSARVHIRGAVLSQLLATRSGPTTRHAGVDLLRCRGGPGVPSPLHMPSAAGGTFAVNDAVMFLAPELLAQMLVVLDNGGTTTTATEATARLRFGDAWTPAADLWSVGVCAVAYATAGTRAFPALFGACREALATAAAADAREAVTLAFIRRIRDVGDRLRTHLAQLAASDDGSPTGDHRNHHPNDDADFSTSTVAFPASAAATHVDALDDQLASIAFRTLVRRLPERTLRVIADLVTWDAGARLDTDTARRYHITADASGQRHLLVSKAPPIALLGATKEFGGAAVSAAVSADEQDERSFVRKCLADRRAARAAGSPARNELPSALRRFRQAIERLAVSDAGTNASPDAREALVCTEHLALLLPQWLAVLVPPAAVGGAVLWPAAVPTTAPEAVVRQEAANLRGRFFATHWWRPNWPPPIVFGAVRSNFLAPPADDAVDVPGAAASGFDGAQQPRSSSVSSSSDTLQFQRGTQQQQQQPANPPLSETATQAIIGRRPVLVDAGVLAQACAARARAIVTWVGSQMQRQGVAEVASTAPPVFPSVLDVAYGDGGRRRLNAATVEAAAAAAPVLDPPFSVAGFYAACHGRGGGGAGDSASGASPVSPLDAASPSSPTSGDEGASATASGEVDDAALARALLEAARDFRRSAPRQQQSESAGDSPAGGPALPWIEPAATAAFAAHVRYLLRTFRATAAKATATTIPAAARLEVWAALLGVPDHATCERLVAPIEVYAITACDRQIAVDIPRCHQYHALLRTTEGHVRIWASIKRWLALNPDLRYWQGVHDVCAPLLALGWDAGGTVAMCLTRLVREHVPHFFAPNAMRVRIAAFSALLQFHDAPLANHLHRTHECQPDMYAVSWFLTLFAHVLPTEKVFVLWDAALLSGDVDLFFLCVGVALVRRHRLHLLNSDFSQVVQILFASAGSADVLATIDAARALAAASPPLLRPLREWGCGDAPGLPGPVQEVSLQTVLDAYRSRAADPVATPPLSATTTVASSRVAAGGIVLFTPVPDRGHAAAAANERTPSPSRDGGGSDAASSTSQPLRPRPHPQRYAVLGAHVVPTRPALPEREFDEHDDGAASDAAGGMSSRVDERSAGLGPAVASSDGRRTPPPASSGSLWSNVLRRRKSDASPASQPAPAGSVAAANNTPPRTGRSQASTASVVPSPVATGRSATGGGGRDVDETWDVVRSPTPSEEHLTMGDDAPRFMVADARLRRMLHTPGFVAPSPPSGAAAATAQPGTKTGAGSGGGRGSHVPHPLVVVLATPRLTMDGTPLPPSETDVDAAVPDDVASLASLLVERFDAGRVAVVAGDGAAVGRAFVEAGLRHLLRPV